jgi:uncharacterized membrane protein
MNGREFRSRGGEQLAGDLAVADMAMAQLYRGELARSDRWRTRLDTTTNWALTTTAAVITYSLSNVDTPHVTLLVGIWLVINFLLLEARRYRYYDLWNRRLRLLEDGYWAQRLRREPVDPDALHELALELERPQLQLSLFSAVATRMNRAYGALFLVLVLAWAMKVVTHPRPTADLQEIIRRAHVGLVPGMAVLTGVAVFMLAVAALFAVSFMARAPLGELRVRPRSGRRALWEVFARPYELKHRRQRSGRPPISPAQGP